MKSSHRVSTTHRTGDERFSPKLLGNRMIRVYFADFLSNGLTLQIVRRCIQLIIIFNVKFNQVSGVWCNMFAILRVDAQLAGMGPIFW